MEMESNNQSLSDLLIKSTIQYCLETSLCPLDDSVTSSENIPSQTCLKTGFAF